MAKRPSKERDFFSKKQLSRKEKEARQKRLLYVIAGVTVLASLLVLGVGFYQEYIAKPSSPVAIVNGQTVSTRDYQRMVQYQRFQLASQIAMLQGQLAQLDPTAEEQQFLVQYFQQQLEQIQAQQASVPLQALEDMIDDELVRQEASRRGIVVTEGEVQQEIERQFGYERNPPTPTPTPITATVSVTVTPTPTTVPMTQEEFSKSYAEYVVALRKNVGLSEPAFRRLFESSMYRSKLQEALAAEVPTTAEQIHARHILVETEEEAQKVKERLNAGEDFAALADELSADSAASGGDLGWFPRGQMVTEFEDAAFALQPGETSEIITTTFGYHIIKVLERDPARPLDETTLSQNQASALEEWLAQQRQSDAVQRFWSSSKVPPAA